MLKPNYPYYLGGKAFAPNQDLVVTDKYTSEVATRVAIADVEAIDAGIQAAANSNEEMRRMHALASPVGSAIAPLFQSVTSLWCASQSQ